MKKLVLSLLGAATLAASSNAMALDTTVTYGVAIQRGAAPIPVGRAMFEFDSDVPFGAGIVPPTVFPGTLPFPNGACEYDMQWDNFLVPLGLSAECFLLEQKIHGSQSCVLNSMMGVTSILVSDPSLPCSGFDWFQNIDVVSQISLGETFSPSGAPHAVLEGVIQFNSPIVGHAVYGLELVSL